jgi:hypothetical protein
MFVLGQKKSPPETIHLLTSNLRGEITP